MGSPCWRGLYKGSNEADGMKAGRGRPHVIVRRACDTRPGPDPGTRYPRPPAAAGDGPAPTWSRAAEWIDAAKAPPVGRVSSTDAIPGHRINKTSATLTRQPPLLRQCTLKTSNSTLPTTPTLDPSYHPAYTPLQVPPYRA
jgi:hypothetical protein